MNRLTQLRSEAGGSRDSALSTSASEAYLTANESSSKYFSLSEEDSSYDIDPIKDVSLASAVNNPQNPVAATDSDQLISDLSPIPKQSQVLDDFKLGKQIEAANILSGGVNIFDDNENSYDGDELVIDDNVVDIDDKNSALNEAESNELAALTDNEGDVGSKDTEIVLQIDGKNVNAINIGNGLYLYRKDGQEELAAVQIMDDGQPQPSFKFLKVRENAEGNLEVYEEIEVEVPKEAPAKEVKNTEKNISHIPDTVVGGPIASKAEAKAKTLSPSKEAAPITQCNESIGKELEVKIDHLNSKMAKVSETRKSPVIHSTPNKEGIPLTKTMVDQQLHPHRHLDKVKTIEVHTDFTKQKLIDSPYKSKDNAEGNVLKSPEISETQAKASIINVSGENPINAKYISEKQVCPELKLQNSMKKSNTEKNECNVSNFTGTLAMQAKHSTVTENTINEKEISAIQASPDLKQGSSEVKSISEENNSKILKSPKTLAKPDKATEENTINEKEISEKRENLMKKSTSEINPEGKVLKSPETSAIPAKVTEENSIIENEISEKQTSENENPVQISTSVEISKESQNSIEQSKISNEHQPKDIKHFERDLQEANAVQVKPKTKDINKEPEIVASGEAKASVYNKIPKETIKVEIAIKEKVELSSKPSTEIIVAEKDNKPLDNLSMNNDYIALSVTQMKTKDFKEPNSVKACAKTDSMKSNKTDINMPQNQKGDKNVMPQFETGDTKFAKSQHLTSGSIAVSKSEDSKSTRLLIGSTSVSQCEVSTYVPPKIPSTKSNMPIMSVRSLPVKANIRAGDNNNAAVPFGKWTEANRQEFLNKIKGSKAPSTMTNSKQIKQPNDLNKREFLQKIDIHRLVSPNSTVKCNEQATAQRLKVKPETKSYTNKPIETHNSKVDVKNVVTVKSNVLISEPDKIVKTETTKQTSSVTPIVPDSNQDPHQIRNNQDLIDKTIEGIINRVITAKPEEIKPNLSNERKKDAKTTSFRIVDESKDKQPASLDAIEMKMNELHGIPFVERPPHQLPRLYKPDVKTYSKADNLNTSQVKPSKVSSLDNMLLEKDTKKNVLDVDSEEETIEHQPITGDIDLSKKGVIPKNLSMLPLTETITVTTEASKNKTFITEIDFDKFARRNSVTYENQLTVKFEGNDSTNVLQSIVEKDPPQVKKFSRNELLLAEAKVKSDQKQLNRINHPSKAQVLPKTAHNDDQLNKNYQSKLQIAYHSAMTAKRKIEPPITIIEDKPVKVMFIDTNTEFKPAQLNAQGKHLSPVKQKTAPEFDAQTVSVGEPPDSNVIASSHTTAMDDKIKGKHQRKQVLTSVETPELELIEPRDLGITSSPRKKRKTEAVSVESPNSVVPKKNYLLGRNKVTEETEYSAQDLSKSKSLGIDLVVQNTIPAHKDTASAIDNLVKAAELLETQSEKANTSSISINSEYGQSTPAKRGRGRPRKYPLGEGLQDKNKIPSPYKRPRLIDAKVKETSVTDEDTSDDDIVRENWTMGKINENIVCPICKKLFRSENVVFKHVKHCTGPSPNRSESDSTSRRSRQSQESETKSVESKGEDVDYEPPEHKATKKLTPKKHKSKDVKSEASVDADDVIVIEDTPKEKPRQHESRISSKTKVLPEGPLACDICGKTFRQLSYLVSHKWQHKKEESKKVNRSTDTASKSVFSCEVCKKEFRKLHHLVQHRLIHNPSSVPTRASRKSSSEQVENKSKTQSSNNPVDDPSAAFRCEPCDKSFRKLHHLVEHRETHDGQNRQKGGQIVAMPENKPASEPLRQCDICNKTFRKLHQLLEHKEQHNETSSEKSDDKSIKSSLSTKDIIHECQLCYMVFPNEQSLNKHSVFCQKKKKPSALPTKPAETVTVEECPEVQRPDEKEVLKDTPKVTKEDTIVEKKPSSPTPPKLTPSSDNEVVQISENPKIEGKVTPVASPDNIMTNKKEVEVVASDKLMEAVPTKLEVVPDKIKKLETKIKDGNAHKVNPRKKTQVKEKTTPAVERRQRISNPAPSQDVTFPESSDDDDVRYMLNPDHKTEESKLFLVVRAKKRSSLQIDKPSKDSAKRRASMQDPPRLPRFKSKLSDTKALPTKTAVTKNFTKTAPIPSSDSDDSDVKYSFPEPVAEKPTQVDNEAKKAVQVKRKSVIAQRKSLSGIAKVKSIGKSITHKAKEKAKSPTTERIIKRRTLGVDHRCDCGQPFSSAALLARHISLAHTPPRVRRRRSPPPPQQPPSQATTTKSSAKTKPPRKSTSGKADKKKATPENVTKIVKKNLKSTFKSKHALSVVPIPNKTRKQTEKPRG